MSAKIDSKKMSKLKNIIIQIGNSLQASAASRDAKTAPRLHGTFR